MRINYNTPFDISQANATSSPLINTYVNSFVPANSVPFMGYTTHPLFELLLDLDPTLLILELYIATLFLLYISASSFPKEVSAWASRELATLCLRSGLSLTEISCILTGAIGFLVFDLVSALVEDDSLEVFGVILLFLIVLTSFVLCVQAGVGLFSGFSSLGGAALLRAVLADGLNFFLGLLRVAFCFVRYAFYDLQGELVDFAFHGTEVEDRGLLAYTLPNYIFLDLALFVLQSLIAIAKLALALYLFWLMVDTFLLRPLAIKETRKM